MEPGIYHQTFYHDDGCKTLFSRDMADCRCKVEVKLEKSTGEKFTKDKIMNDMKQFLRNKSKYN